MYSFTLFIKLSLSPLAIISPSSKSKILSILDASAIYAVEISAIILSFFLISSTIFQSSILLNGSTPVVGSSKIKSFGLFKSVKIKESFCLIPPLRFPASLSLNFSSPAICRSLFSYSTSFLTK